MKKFKLLTVLLILTCSLLCLFGCTKSEEKFSVSYIIDGEQIISAEFGKDGKISPPSFIQKDGYTLKGWFLDDGLTHKLNFETDKIQNNVTLYGTWLKNYSVTFVAEGKTIKIVYYNSDTENIEEPSVPAKAHYSGVWENYKLDEKDIVVNAVYSPITYVAVFKADEEIISEINYTVEDKITLPEIPEKIGYTAEWVGLPLSGGNTTITAKYTPIVYTVTFKYDNNTVGTCKYTVENKDITPPEVPERKGYAGEWSKYELTTGDVTVNAVYSLKTFKATFVAGYNKVSEQYFDAENMLLIEPEVPLKEKPGYTTCWEEYKLGYEDIIINAIYVPVIYTAQFVINNDIILRVQFTVESTSLPVPEITEKPGYTAEWEKFEIKAQNLTVNAVYTPITYYATFVCDATVVEKIPFTVETREITQPAPLLKAGYIVKWENYALGCKDITVKAIYTEIVKDEFTYEELTDDTLKVTGYTGEDTEITIPSEHEGKLVKVIGYLAFSGSHITGLTIGYGIETIEKEAFLNCNKLKYAELPESLKTIGENAFAFCGFTELTVPNSVTKIEKWAFAHSLLESVKLSDSLENLIDIFYHCENLENVILGKGLKTICAQAFNMCPKLTKLTIPSSVCEIQPRFLTESENVTEIYFEDKNGWYFYDGSELGVLESQRLDDPETAAIICKSTNNYLKKKP